MAGCARVLVTLALALPVGCTRDGQRPAAPHGAHDPQVVLSPEGGAPVRVKVELARTAEQQQRGLMFRDKLEPGRGMLFLFESPRHLVFWMRNTYIPLDMIFIGPDRRVVGVVENATPLTDTPRSVEGISQFVLEVPGGWAGTHRIGPGTSAGFLDVDSP